MWQVKPAKKSINFGLFRHSGQGPVNDGELVQHRKGSVSLSAGSTLDERLAASGLEKVHWVGKCPAGELHKGEYVAESAGTYALVFDNMFSKNTAKTVLFSAKVVDPGKELQPPPVEVPTEDGDGGQGQITLVSDGRHLSGIMLKKRRKKLQGYAKRWFVLDNKYGVLNYFLDQKSSFMRGSMLIKLCSISAVARTREIIIDSGMEVWYLKAINNREFHTWIEALDGLRTRGALARSRPVSMVPQQGFGTTATGGGDEWIEIERLVQRLDGAFGRLGAGDDAATTEVGTVLKEFQGLLAVRHASKHFAGLRSPGQRRSLESVLSGDDEFYDADETLDGVVFVDAKTESFEEEDQSDVSASGDEVEESATTTTESSTVEEDDLYPLNESVPAIKRRRDVPKAVSTPPSLIGLLRNNVGKDMTTIAMPVTCNEPITILQRLSEIVEYSQLLDQAARAPNECERLLLLATFAMSGMSSQRSKERALRKPFNPLLGETFELVREDKGFRYIAEKVSHRPPVMAIQIESPLWVIHYSARPHQKFWGKSAELTDSGPIHITFRNSGESYEYIQPSTFLRNLIAGEKYLEPVGSISIESPSGALGTVEFKSGGMFSGRSEAVIIRAVDAKGANYPTRLEGKWTESVSEVNGSGSKGRIVWKADSLVSSPKETYGFTEFTASLNQITPIEEGHLPPTDSRLRPDQQMYENGEIDKAEKSKLDLEERQRQRRKAMEERHEQWTPTFFQKSTNGGYVLRSGRSNYWNRRRTGDWADVPHLW
jgi:hypothetical protein